MRFVIATAAVLALAAAGSAQAHGCVKGAVVGGVAGHMAGKHATAGAVGGCVVGHHMAKTKEKKAAAAMDKGNTPPPLPPEADAGCAPHVPRLVLSDATVERVGVIAANQPKGVLQFRDELAGWLLAMEARNGGSDRAFWLEAFGGRGFTVERMGRAPLTVERLLIGALGGIQPDRLSELLLKAKDDGLLARFLPIWPERLPPRQPERLASDTLADAAMARLVKDALRAQVDAGKTVIVTTHILEVAERMADRIGIIAGGRLLAEGTLQDLRDRAGTAGMTLEDTFIRLTSAPVTA